VLTLLSHIVFMHNIFRSNGFTRFTRPMGRITNDDSCLIMNLQKGKCWGSSD